MKYALTKNYSKILADTTTPVSIYLRQRDTFPNSLLLESSEYHSRDNNISYICCEPNEGITLNKEQLRIVEPGAEPVYKNAHEINLREEVSAFRQNFSQQPIEGVNVISSGLFGYFTFDTIEHFEDIKLTAGTHPAREIPFMQYHVYRYVIAIDHFRNQLYIFENLLNGEPSDLDRLEYLIQNKNFPEYHFKRQGGEDSTMTDEDF